MGMAGMGYAFGAAIGAACATGRRCVVLAGDGAFFMHGLEIHTAVEHALPITYIMLNNSAHGMCLVRERLLLGEELPGHELERVDPDAIRWEAEPLLEHLERAPGGAYDAVSLSNVSDGADERWVRDLRKAAVRAIAPGGAIVARSFATTMDDDAAKRARRDRAMLWGSIVVHRS